MFPLSFSISLESSSSSNPVNPDSDISRPGSSSNYPFTLAAETSYSSKLNVSTTK